MRKNLDGGETLLDSTKIAITRLCCGTALLISTIVFKVDGVLTGVSLFLLGVPAEYLARKEEST